MGIGPVSGNLEKGLRLRAAGLIDQETIDGVAKGMVATIQSPGGAQWWKVYRKNMASPIVAAYVDRRIGDPLETQPPWDEQWTSWADWAAEEIANDASASKEEG